MPVLVRRRRACLHVRTGVFAPLSLCPSIQVGGDEKLQFDIPFRDLGFDGVPHKSACFLMPTKGALVNLTEQPVFVCSLGLVDHVHLQRVSFKSKHFEMIIFWKDWERCVQ